MYEINRVPKRIVIYARVSTEHEAQINALENQLDWYKPILEMHKEWQVVNWYVDKGITGTSAEKRPQFMQMIFDAKCGKFDMIITREVSRFARNTVDMQIKNELERQGRLTAMGKTNWHCTVISSFGATPASRQ